MPEPSNRSDDPLRSALFTDLYELTMARAYLEEGMEDTAVFELFFRELPAERAWMMAAGLEAVLTYLEGLQFTEDDLDYLAAREEFPAPFLERLRSLRFTGEVHAMQEGTLVFPHEPIVQVVAPILEAQIIETFLLNQVHFQTLAATKAARVVLAAEGRTVVDFGSRRAHGADAALAVARATWLAGGAGTSNVLAGKRYGVPIFGTMAHSYVQAHDDESKAFEAFSALYPGTTLLVDTYDTLEGVRKVIELAERRGEGFDVRALRLDSGDLAALARDSRRLLDEAGLEEVKLFASSGLDEHAIARFVREEVPIDGFGVGTRLAVSPDAPHLDMAYKLVSYDGRPRMKLSSSKKIHPGRKQVFRRSEDGAFAGDRITTHDATEDGEPLLRCVMRDGRRTEAGASSLEEARLRAAAQLASLPSGLRTFEAPKEAYPVSMSERIRARTEDLEESLEERMTRED